jgi:SPP1 family predicted phage head-tail adaptor
MNIRKLRHRIELQSSISTRGQAGSSVPQWITYANVWAAIGPLRGKALETARQVVSTATHTVTVRYNGEILPRQRIKFGERHFEINTAASPEERGRWTQIICTEVI